MKQILVSVGIALLSLVTVTQCGGPQKQEGPILENGMYARMTTTKGDILLALEFEKTPLTVANFVGLAEGKIKNSAKGNGEPYYDDLVFHRVIPDFMIQGGDPLGTGTGGPGYKFADEFDSSLTHSGPGILSMANAGPGTNGSQFFITHTATPHLNGKHTVFGHVIEGQDVVNSIVKGDKIISLKIERIGATAEAFVADQAMFDGLLASHKEREISKLKEMSGKMVDKIKEQFPNAIEAPEGYFYVVTKEGEGDSPKPGTMVTAHYTGKFLDGRVFDSSVERGQPFKFAVGSGQVIAGWDYAFLAMKKGDKRTVILPPELAYGSRGVGPIPGNSWLVFDVELISF